MRFFVLVVLYSTYLIYYYIYTLPNRYLILDKVIRM